MKLTQSARGAFAAFLFAAVIRGASAAPGDMVTVGVGSIQSSIRGADPTSFQSMLETQLIKTNKLKVIERARLEEVLREKGLSVAGITDGPGKISGIQGVGYLVYGTITKLGATKQNMNFGGFSVGSSKVEMAVDLKVVDASSGEIAYADTVEESTDGGQHTNFGGFRQGGSEGDPLADVERKTAKSIAGVIITTIYPIKIITVQHDGKAVLNYGDSLFSPGDQLKVFELGESFKDPDTGKTLGAEEKQVALLKIVEVTPKFSKAIVVNGTCASGNIARRLTAADLAASKPQADTGGRLPD